VIGFLLDQALFSAGALGEKGIRYIEDSFSLFGEPTVPGKGGDLSVLTRSGEPRAFDTKTSSGDSDHLPFSFRLALS
jgi:hypothetical protein